MEIKIKKPKKSKKKSTRQRVDDDDDADLVGAGNAADDMEVDQAPSTSTMKPRTKDIGFNDDEDLASALSFSRRAALKKQKRRPEDIVKQLKEEGG